MGGRGVQRVRPSLLFSFPLELAHRAFNRSISSINAGSSVPEDAITARSRLTSTMSMAFSNSDAFTQGKLTTVSAVLSPKAAAGWRGHATP